jgi:NAD dependent epimerase/dehydratase
MKVLVTGADGFIGSHLTELLLMRGNEVRALSYYNSFNYWGWLEDIERTPSLEIVSGDVRDPGFCRSLTKGIETVFHLAALIAIPYSYKAPASFIDTNIYGTHNICQAALDNDVRLVICTSTSEVYGTANYIPIDEKHPLQPQSPYSASKIGADAVAMSFYKSYQLPVVISRPFNTYGPRQSARAVIPTIITQIATGINEVKLGDTSPTRDFNFVEDTCRGFLALAECPEAIGEVVNIGSNHEISIHDTFDLIREIMESEVELIPDHKRYRPEYSEVRRLCCDNSKILGLTGFTPRFSLRQGLEKTIEWFIQPTNLAKYKATIYNL